LRRKNHDTKVQISGKRGVLLVSVRLDAGCAQAQNEPTISEACSHVIRLAMSMGIMCVEGLYDDYS
jgi:hypothetical protein